MIAFKPEVRKKDLLEIKPEVLQIFSELLIFAKNNNLPVMVTSIRSDIVKNRLSSTHKDGRAIDVSSRDWSIFAALELQDHINNKFKHIGAISSSDGKPRACVWHDAGYGSHFHLQCRKDLFKIS